MNLKYMFLLMFILYETVSTGPALREIGSWLEELEPEEKVREKRKVDLLQHLQDGGVGVKRVLEEKDGAGTAKTEDLPTPEKPVAVDAGSSEREEEGTRTKKQAPDYVCIKEAGNGGKTSCGRIVSARGPGTRMFARNDLGTYSGVQGIDHGKMDKYMSMQSRTFDSLLPLSSLTSGVTYTVPAATYTTDTATTIGHTLPAIAAPAVPLAPLAPLAHVEPISLLSHSIPIHPMHTMFTHRPLMNLNLQRVEVPKLPEIIYTPTEIKQQAYEVKPIVTTQPIAAPITAPISAPITAPISAPVVYPSRYGVVNHGYDSPMICHPYDEKLSQQVIQIRPEVHVIEPGHKSSNSTVEEFKSQMDEGGEDDEKKVRDHLRQVSEIREEINQLNRAAQKIVDQQERLAEMQQRQLWRSGDKISYTSPYNDLRMYMVPPAYSRASAVAYPTSIDDVEYFMNLMKAGKKFGTLADSIRPTLTSATDALNLVLTGEQSGQSSGSNTKLAKQESAKVQQVNSK